ncbi:erythromycin esterase family protein [Sporosarcina sp. G11-34]|uniref:erythromycin esterase family protein n=1 Tax=Sporosarcina sp. G11-34 TaxID=2849605 RepID=UPI0022A94A4C|nr:erythromycin esterase family protein [Sporosarcina sp. G11-34]MCZ2257886.1 erythromycin esterase family protein [Sporosarcina sp. G11-34]
MNFTLEEAVEKYALPFESNDDLTPLIDAIGDAKIVLLGEASHGTSEFYTVRAKLSKMLIEQKGFTAIAVEGDWPTCRHVNRYIKGHEDETMTARDVLKAFNRWPTWMWANEEIADLVDWLKSYNSLLGPTQKIGFYGIDLYSLWESMEEILYYLTRADSLGVDLELAKKVLTCFEPFNRLPEHYAIATAHHSQTCAIEVGRLFSSIGANEHLYPTDFEQSLNLKMNALVTKNAEAYYRTSVQTDEISWNIRDGHMVEAINEVRKFYGEDTKIIVWEHNTHIGDARATAMKDEGMLNVGQLLREQNKKEDVFAVGFGTHNGTVVAANEWGVPFEKLEVPSAKKDSWEDVLHKTGTFNKLLIFNEENREHFTKSIDHRAIGVVYNPQFEAHQNYIPSIIGDRYDAFIFINETTALQPLDTKQ